MTLAALDATLRLYLHPEKLADRLPVLRLLTRDAASIRAQAELLLPRIAPHYPDFDVRIEPCQSQIGSGSLPVDRLPSEALTFTRVTGAAATGGPVVTLARHACAGYRADLRWTNVAGSALP